MISYTANDKPLGWPFKPAQPPKRPGAKRMQVPDSITDPLSRDIMQLVLDTPITWDRLEVGNGLGQGVLRRWLYRGTFNPRLLVVQKVLATLGYRLRLERL